RFNPLSVTVTNPTRRPQELTFTLSQDGGLRRIGARHVDEVYLGPGDTRVLRFYPFVNGDGHEWRLEWGRRGSYEIPAPDHGPEAHVLLNDPDSYGRSARGIRALPDNLFPPTVVATEGLASVVIDHAPRWDAAVSRAFMDWLRLGGRVCILRGVGDTYPVFTGALDPLNHPADDFTLGGGRVTRHHLSRVDLDVNVIENTLGLKSYEPQTPRFATSWGLESSIINAMKVFTRVDHNWPLIYFAAVVFVALVGPVHYWRARKGLNYPASLSALLVVVVLFCWIFFTIGRRGYGEQGGAYAYAHARDLGQGRYAVTQYVNAFVTRGGVYDIRYGAERSLFTTAQQQETVSGDIRYTQTGAFLVDIPVFTSRGYVHSGVSEASPIEVRVERWIPPSDVSLVVGEGFPDSAVSVFALSGRYHLELRRVGNRLVSSGSLRPIADWGGRELFNDHPPSYSNRRRLPGGHYWDENQPRSRVFQELAPTVVADRLGLKWRRQQDLALNPDTIRLFVLAPMPEAFQIQSGGITHRDSYVLYDLEIPTHDTNRE
ncbi:MAG: hypothetical protein ACYTGQ_03185, partial [Planctomycetota bacterium]